VTSPDTPGPEAARGRAGALADIRIADLTIITAGASATNILADFGADVIKVESGRWMDPFRNWEGGWDGDGERPRPWDESPPFLCVNRNKRDLTLDLKRTEGRELFLRLVERSDVVAENFRHGVMDRLGLGFEQLRAVKPDIVMISLSSQGLTGPESGYASFGSTLDALSGMMSVTGYGPDEPVWTTNEVNYPDQVVSTFGASLIMLGLRQRDRTGEAVHIDLSQRELVTSMIGETVLDYTVNRRIGRPQANRDRSMAPHGVYPCRGDDEWIAIAVETDEQWASLANLIGGPALAADERYAAFPGRWRSADELDRIVAAWTAQQDRQALMTRLQAARVPAGAVLGGPELWADANLAARGFYRDVTSPLSGAQRQRGWPFRLSRTPAAVVRPAPVLGEHTTEILADVLGLTAEEIAELDATGVTTNDPSAR
jgi:crotonobetainyl-CoA:carnitine CoA-transferase CaiB-like acyl-CoA transferase